MSEFPDYILQVLCELILLSELGMWFTKQVHVYLDRKNVLWWGLGWYVVLIWSKSVMTRSLKGDRKQKHPGEAEGGTEDDDNKQDDRKARGVRLAPIGWHLLAPLGWHLLAPLGWHLHRCIYAYIYLDHICYRMWKSWLSRLKLYSNKPTRGSCMFGFFQGGWCGWSRTVMFRVHQEICLVRTLTTSHQAGWISQSHNSEQQTFHPKLSCMSRRVM